MLQPRRRQVARHDRDPMAVVADQHACWAEDLARTADKMRTLAELHDRNAVRAGLAEIAAALDELAAALAPGAC